MATDPVHDAELRAMDRLGWTALDLYTATFEYANVGSLYDVQEHLRTGDHLPPEKKAYITAALWEAELAAVNPPPASPTDGTDAAD